MKSRGGLGKGLEALIPQIATDALDEVIHIKLTDLVPNPYQPRHDFDSDKLVELMNSIREHGVLQPIVVRKRVSSGYEIVAGERRFRAVQMLGLDSIPSMVRDISDKDAMEIALIENLQRDDLNPIEIAEAFKKLMDLFSFTQDQLADRVGQSRSHVANILRLLALPVEVRNEVSRGTISMGHARALLSIKEVDQQLDILESIKRDHLNVRDVESLVQRPNSVSRETNRTVQKKDKNNPQIQMYENTLQERLGTSVRIKYMNGKGRIVINYFSNDDLTRILDIMEILSKKN